MKLTISVVTPSFNQAKFIERTILSVLEQDAPPAEYVVFDGGSTDDTVTILKKYEDRLRWVSEKDTGQTQAVNKGIKATSGDVIGWINSDDIYYPGTFKTVLECFEKYPDVNVIYGNANHIDENDNTLEPYYTEKWNYERLKDICFLCQPAVFFRRDVIEKVGLLDETLQYCMDYEYWLRAGAELKFHYLTQTLAGSRMYNGNKTLGARTKVHAEICNMLYKQIGHVPSKWVFAYAHAIADEQGYNRSDPWQNTCYCSTLLTESSKKFLELNGEITIKDMHTMAEWIGGTHSEFLNLIEKLNNQLTEHEKDRAERLTQLEKVNHYLEEVESERKNRFKLIAKLEDTLADLEKDRNDRLTLIEKLNKQLIEVDRDYQEGLKQINQLSDELREANALLGLYKETMNNSWYGRYLLKKLEKKRKG